MDIEQVKNDVKAWRQMEKFLEALRGLNAEELSLSIREESINAPEGDDLDENNNPLNAMMSMFGGLNGVPMPKSAVMVLKANDMSEFISILRESVQRSIIERKRIVREGVLGIKSHGENKSMDDIVEELVKEIEEENKPKETRVALFKAIGRETIVVGKYVTTGKISMVTIEKGPGEYTELTGHEFESVWSKNGLLDAELVNKLNEQEISDDLEYILGQAGPVKIVDINLIK